jgi:hypothetical protein
MRLTVLLIVLSLALYSFSISQDGPYVQQGSIGKGNKSSEIEPNVFPMLELKNWVGNTIVFLPATKQLQPYGYQSFKGGHGEFGQPLYDECVGRVGLITRVKGQNSIFEVTVEMTDNGHVYKGTVYTETLDGVAFTRDIDSARTRWIGDTLWYTDDELLQYDIQKDNVSAIIIDKYSPVVVTNVVAGWHNDSPIRLIITTLDGKEGFVDLNVSNTNVASILWEYSRFSKSFFTYDPRLVFDWPPTIWHQIEKGIVSIGMTPEQVQLSWGYPKNVSRTVTAAGQSVLQSTL